MTDPTTVTFTADDLRRIASRAVLPKVQYRSAAPVPFSPDLRRILAVPRRVLNIKDPLAATLWTRFLRRERTAKEGPCDCVRRWGFCILELNAMQGWALENAMDARALFAALGVGSGKTGIDILAAMAIPGVTRALLIIPASLKPQFLSRDYPQWSAHFKTPLLAGGPAADSLQIGRPTLHVVTYNEVSSMKNPDLIPRINPDLIIGDEIDALGDPNAVRTGRFLDNFGKKPSLRLVAQTGSFSDGSIKKFAHFLALCFRDHSPVPHEPDVVDAWASALDAADKRNPYPREAGALLELCGPEEASIKDEQERARAGFSRRLWETLGCITTTDPDLPVNLEILERKPPEVPERVRVCIRSTMENSERPDGETLQTPLEVSAVVKRLSAGFYYRWRFPKVQGGHCTQHPEVVKTCEECLLRRKVVIEQWRAARKKYRSEVRATVVKQIPFLDSPGLLEHAARRWHLGYTHNDHGKITEYPPRCSTGPKLVWESEHWEAWQKVKDTVEHVQEPVWESDWLARDAVQWAKEHNGIIWYQHRAFADMVKKIADEEGLVLPVYGQGKEASAAIILEKGDRPILASVKAHGTGKNLQHAFCESLFANVFSSPREWEQTIGRTHRQGQKRNVTIEVYRHTEDYRQAIRTAQARARFIEQTLRNRQRLALATIGWEDDQAEVWDEAREKKDLEALAAENGEE